MRNGFYFFLTIVLGIYFLTNLYIGWRTHLMLAGTGPFRWSALGVLILLVLSYPLGRYLEHHNIVPWGFPFIWIGSFWIAAMLYFFLLFFAISLVDVVAWISGFDAWFKWRPILWSITTLLTLSLMVYGHWNALHPRIVRLDWKLPKLPPQTAPFKIVAVTDVHMGTLVGRDRVEKIVSLINEQQPDLVLLVGDTIDSDLAPVIRENTGDALKTIRSKFGVYAVTGNHEYIGGVEPSVDYLEAHGVKLLRNSAVLINDSFFLVGREDASSDRFSRNPRMPLAEIVGPLDRTRPIFLMDHQPVALDEAEKLEVDAQISGHTHDGQFWPITYIPRSLFKLSYGFKQFGPLHAYVSCGIGTWGPTVRIGNHPELVVITLHP